LVSSPACPSASSSEKRFTIARLKKKNSENARSHGEGGTPVAAEPAMTRIVEKPSMTQQ
jgi:hypothetical protein